eukprot:9096549-Pyramimonas_sp.AAC.1
MEILTVLLHLMHWSEGCPCHSRKEAFANWQKLIGASASTCPMAGRRAPNLAAGELMAVLNELWDTCIAQFLMRECRALPPSDKATIQYDPLASPLSDPSGMFLLPSKR